jgi:hypothetical protein
VAIHYVSCRTFRGACHKPEFIVLGEEHGQVLRRVFRSRGLAERFVLRTQKLEGVRHLQIVALPK